MRTMTKLLAAVIVVGGVATGTSVRAETIYVLPGLYVYGQRQSPSTPPPGTTECPAAGCESPTTDPYSGGSSGTSGGGQVPGGCTETQAMQGICGALDATRSARVLAMINMIQDCLPLRSALLNAYHSGKIRAVWEMPRGGGKYAVGTTYTATGVVILSIRFWDADVDSRFVNVLRHEGGHLLFPNGAYRNGQYFDSEQMAQKHGTCYQ